MNTRTTYKTRQREELIRFFASVPGEHITAADVCSYFKNQGTPIGQATVYRQLEKLVDEGILNKYIVDNNCPACFEYVVEEDHADAEHCFHCRCEQCGKLIHLHCDELLFMQEHLLDHHQFLLNPMRTVFYGVCEQCRSLTQEAAE